MARSGAALATAVLLWFASAGPVVGQPAGGADAQSGRDAFSRAGCEGCHGENGRGAAAGPALALDGLALERFIAYVRAPAGVMPAVGEAALSETELTDIYAFLRANGVQPAAPAGRAEQGARLYRATGCYQCHANEAQGGTQGPRIGPDPIPFARFAWYLRHPTGEMPPYSAAVMSDQDVADIYAFLQARPHPPEIESISLLAP